MSARLFAVVLALVAATLTSGAASAASPPIMFGLSTVTPAGQSPEQAMAVQEAKLGRRYDFTHRYHQWNTVFPNADERARLVAGQPALLSWQGTFNTGGTKVQWADITAGRHNTVIDRMAENIKSVAPTTVFLNFENEPDLAVDTPTARGKHGTAAQYRAAWQYLVKRFAARGVGNVKWTIVFAGIASSNNRKAIETVMWPGAAYVDWVAWDPYNWAEARGAPWKSFTQTVAPWYSWATTHLTASRPYMLAETGTQELSTDPQAKAGWFNGMAADLQAQRFPLLRAVSYFNHSRAEGGVSGDWLIDSSPQSRSAFNAAVNATYGGAS